MLLLAPLGGGRLGADGEPAGELRVTPAEPVAETIRCGRAIIRIKFSCCPTFERSSSRSPGLPVSPKAPPRTTSGWVTRSVNCACSSRTVQVMESVYSGSLPGSPGGSWVSSRLLPSEVNTPAGTCCGCCCCKARRGARCCVKN